MMKNMSKIAGLVLVLIVFAFLSSPPTTTTKRHLATKQTKNNQTATNQEVTIHPLQHDGALPEAKSEDIRVLDCRTNDANDGSINIMVNLKSNATFLHIGKAGGGTIFKERLPAWQVNVQRCHPRPCRPPRHKQQMKNDTKLFLINVRDPVDRFESAFYFVKSLYCHLDTNKEARRDPHKGKQNPVQNEETASIQAPNTTIPTNNQNNNNISRQQASSTNDGIVKTTRTTVVGGLSDQRLAVKCKYRPKKRSVKAYYVKYKENANLLAEALCSDDAMTRMEAQKDLYDIDHLLASLDGWMKVLYSWPAIHNDNVFPIVMMPLMDSNNKNDNLELQVDQAVQWLYNKLHFESPQDFQSRHRAVQCQQHDNTTTMVTTPKPTFRHSSKNANNPVLSEKSRACLAEFYWKDYKWLDHIQKQLCKTVDCEQTINVILKQRAALG